MPNNDILIVLPSGEIIPPTLLKSDTIVFDESKRQQIIQIMRQIPAFFDGVKKLSEEKTYQAIFPKDVSAKLKDGLVKLDKKDNGLYGVLIRDSKTGHISDHVSLREITPDLLDSLNQVAIQQSLANIVQRLEVIDEKITDVLQGQINDRLAEVESGIHIYEQALVATNPDIKRELIISAIQKLNDGRNKLIKSTDLNFVDKLPRNRIGMFFNSNWDIPKYVQSKAESVWKAAHAIIKASRYLVLAYSDLDQTDSLRVSLEQVENEIECFQDKIGEIVNWLPPTSNWRDSLTMISQGILPTIHELDTIPNKNIIIDFHPKEFTSEGV